jgi:hypothetical protein
MRWHDPVLETIDQWRRKQPDLPSRTKRNSPPCRDRIANGRAEAQGHEVNDKSTLIFVIEINGKSVLVFNADSQIDAERKA